MNAEQNAALSDGQALPDVSGASRERSRALLALQSEYAAPMGPRIPNGSAPGLVMAAARGANVLDADGNRYVDLAAGFGALLLGHGHPAIVSALSAQAATLLQALGDVYPSDVKLELLARLTALYPRPARAIITQSGSDAVSAALKTAALASGRPGVIAFRGAYHGLGYGPLALCGLRESYREPFAAQLNPRVTFVDYPTEASELDAVLNDVRRELSTGAVGVIVVEPVLGRGGVIVPPQGFLSELSGLAREANALLIADEIWTGLGRAGSYLRSLDEIVPDLICLGKGLGGGMPISAVIGEAELMRCWSREREVVHTSTFAGAPLACAAALATLDVLERESWVARAAALGSEFKAELQQRLRSSSAQVRGAGLMLGLELGRAGAGSALQRQLLERGYITSTGGGARDVLVLTPPLVIDRQLLSAFATELAGCVRALEAP